MFLAPTSLTQVSGVSELWHAFGHPINDAPDKLMFAEWTPALSTVCTKEQWDELNQAVHEHVLQAGLSD